MIDVHARPAPGIRAHLPQMLLLVALNGLVGVLIGQERSLVPTLAEDRFGLGSGLATSLFLVTFGAAKAPANLAAGLLAERFGPRRVLLAGWIFGLPVPLLLMWAPSWSWVIAANLLLGLNQGLTWSTTVLMKLQLARPDQRGRVVGLNEFAGYTAVGAAAFASGLLADRFGLGPEPFVLGLLAVVAGGVLTRFALRDLPPPPPLPRPARPLIRSKNLVACARVGLVNNANDAFAWALLPVLLVREGFSTTQVAAVAATYPVVWGILQLVTGPLSDRTGRRAPVVLGMWLQAAGLTVFATSPGLGASIAAAATLGAGTALAYPALIAAAADVAPSGRRPAAVGFFRMWRDAGYVAGALVFGWIADVASLGAAALAAAALTALSGVDARRNLTRSSEQLIPPTMRP